MRCHYEVLEVDRTATEDEIKRSYRKLALKLHPDKNLDEDPETAKGKFQEIQGAFETLSDLQERAWYDKHREVILRGGGVDGGDDDVGFDLFPFFTASCFDGFHDGAGSFYAVYSVAFVSISDEDGEEHPPFGDSKSPTEVWQEFYAFWTAYVSQRSFVWAEKYDTRQAENRRIARAMEKENKKLREDARKDRNEQVRQLVKFVRKRDPRVKVHNQLLVERRQLNAEKSAEKRREVLQAQAVMLSEAAKKDENTFSMQSMEEQLQNLEDQLDAEQEDNLYCVACDKELRNEKAFVAHRNQKKHLENLALLKEALAIDDLEVDGESEDDSKTEEAESGPLVKPAEFEEPAKKCTKEDVEKAKRTTSKKASKKRSKQNVEGDKMCKVCKAEFPSKNKLFAHLKEYDHASTKGT